MGAPRREGLRLPVGFESGGEILGGVLDLGRSILRDLGDRRAGMGCVRGTGPGVSFRGMIDRLERQHPIELSSPFEGSDRVAGGVWLGRELVGPGEDGALAKLRWSERATDLPMHVHTHSDRCLFVLEGRGFFHVSDQPLDTFDGLRVRTIAAREGDVFVFTRGVMHTFSTHEHAMTLVSCQLPYVPFEDPSQYALPDCRWTAETHCSAASASIHCPGLVPLLGSHHALA